MTTLEDWAAAVKRAMESWKRDPCYDLDEFLREKIEDYDMHFAKEVSEFIAECESEWRAERSRVQFGALCGKCRERGMKWDPQGQVVSLGLACGTLRGVVLRDYGPDGINVTKDGIGIFIPMNSILFITEAGYLHDVMSAIATR